MNRTLVSAVGTLTVLAVTVAWADPKVLILGVDGCRPDALQLADTPNIDALIAAGAVSYTAQNTMTQGSSGPNWSSAMTGVNVPKHGVTSNSWSASSGFAGNRFDQWPHMFSYIEDYDSTLYTASYVGWGPINPGSWADRFADVARSGSQTQNAGRVADLLTTGDPDVIFIQMEGVDSAGHSHDFSPEKAGYLSAIEKADADVGTMLAALYDRPGYIDGSEDWLVLTVTDHGGHGTHHSLPDGGQEVWETFFVATGPSVVAGKDIGSPRIFDVAVTTMHHLGIDTVGPGLDGSVVGIPGPELTRPNFNDRLIVHLPLDGNADDASASGPNGNVSGQPQFGEGMFGQALEFSDPASPRQYLSLGSPDELNFAAEGDYSISLWLKQDAGSQAGAVIASNKDAGDENDSGWVIACDEDGQWRWNLADGATAAENHDPPGRIDDGNWHHLVVTHDRDGNAELYFDGSHSGSVNIWDLGDANSGLPTAVAVDGLLDSAASGSFDGRIDDLAIWGRTLGPREVAMIYNDGQGASLLSLREIPEPSGPMLLASGLLGVIVLGGGSWRRIVAAMVPWLR